MRTDSFANFQADALAAGFDEALERRWPADAVLDTHTHSFSVDAVVTEGEMWLSHAGQTRDLQVGDRFTLDAEVPHAERYGAQGCVVWVARRNRR